jgi:redox-sensitive bicupin YhaK (pirin superfamily)
MSTRTVKSVSTAHTQLEGGGFPVRRPFPSRALEGADPFLMLDEMGPVDWPPGEAIGAPDHPHRGFETVTYLLQGKMQHKDSAGHSGALEPGDVQWMTAGSGVVHSEMPDPEYKERGGVSHGFQLWVNLPKTHKMMQPRYQELPRAGIPTARSDDGLVEVTVVAGEALGVSAKIETVTPIQYLHYRLQPGADVTQAVPDDQRAYAYVFDGAGVFGPDGKPAEAGQLVVFEGSGDVRLRVPDDGEPTQLLLLSGRPIAEPVAWYGPFVMNTREEIVQAIDDFQAGRLGAIEH